MLPSKNIHLRLVSRADLDRLQRFEFSNRSFFEGQINARPAAFYAPGGMAIAIEEAIADASAGRSFQYLVHDDAEILVARVNLNHVRRAHFLSAELGYRVCEQQVGRGIASAAVCQTLVLAFGEHGLRRVEAAVRVGHLASQTVLQRQGFTAFGRSSRSFELKGVWHDRLHLELHIETWASAQSGRMVSSASISTTR